MADRFPRWSWYFVYTREAHPGEHVPAHRTFEAKLAAARRLRDEVGIRRPILVDNLEGTVHDAYGLLPNMTFVLARGGQILYKAMWTSAARVAEYLERTERSHGGLGYAPFYTEQVEIRETDPDAFRRRLAVNGPRAVREWDQATQIWAARAKGARTTRA